MSNTNNVINGIFIPPGQGLITQIKGKKQSSDFQTFTRKRNYSNKYFFKALNHITSITAYNISGVNNSNIYLTTKELERLEKIIKDIQEFRKDLSANNAYSFKELNP